MSEEVKVIEEATEKTEETAKKGWFKRFVMPAFALLAVAAYPSLFMYFTNVTESNLPSIFETAGLFILMAFAGTFFVLVFYRNFSKLPLCYYCNAACWVFHTGTKYAYRYNAPAFFGHLWHIKIERGGNSPLFKKVT